MEIPYQIRPQIRRFDPRLFEVNKLREILFVSKRDARMTRAQALSLLRQMDYPEKLMDFRRVLLNDRETIKVRCKAAVELGRIGSDAAIEILRSALDSKNSVVLRSVLISLGRVGGRTVLQALDRFRDRSDIARTVGWVGRMLTYKLGVEEGFNIEFPAPNRFLKIDPNNAREIEFGQSEEQTAAKAVRDLSLSALDIPLAANKAVDIQCADRNLLYLPNREFVNTEGMHQLLQRKTVLGVLAVRYLVELDSWAAKYYVFIQPSDKPGLVQILLMTTIGTLAFAGEAHIEDKQGTFHVRTVKHPGAMPSSVEGVCHQGQLRFGHGIVELKKTGKTVILPG